MAGASETPHVVSIPVAGTLSVANGVLRYRIPFACELDGIGVDVSTAPTGSTAIFRVNKNGVALSPTVAVAISAFSASLAPTPGVVNGTNTPGGVTPSTVPLTTFAAGDYVTVDVTQVGSTVAGSNAVVTLTLVR